MNKNSFLIGVIGLGRMGYGIASNIIKNTSSSILVYDKDKAKSNKLKSEFGDRCIVCPDLTSIAQSAKVFFICLPLPRVSKEVIFGKNGILKYVKKDAVLIELSTLSPDDSLLINEKCKKKKVSYLESPIKGRENDARLGILHLEVGGAPNVYRRMRPLLKLFSKHIVYTGDVGSASTLKLLRNAPRYTNLILSFEILRLINLLKLNKRHQKILLDGILTNICWVWKRNIDNILAREITPSECIDIREKDTAMIKIFVRKYGRFPLIDLTEKVFSGYKNKDLNNIIKLLEKEL